MPSSLPSERRLAGLEDLDFEYIRIETGHLAGNWVEITPGTWSNAIAETLLEAGGVLSSLSEA